MIHKIQQYLLRHYPLIWNTRVVFVLPIALLIHLLFFFLGYLRIVDFKSIYYKVYLSPPDAIYAFSVLFSLVFIVIWLTYYLRNNAFKSKLFYTWRKLVAEWFIIITVIVVSFSFFLSYQYGYFLNFKKEVAKIDVHKELNDYYMGHLLIPTSLDPYYYLNACEPLNQRKGKIIDTREDLDSRIFSFDYKISYEDSAHLLSNGAPILSYLYPCFTYDILYKTRKFEHSYYSEASIDDGYQNEPMKQLPQDEFLSIKNKVKDLLLAENKDSLAQIVKNYLALVKKYGGTYRLDVYAHILTIFEEPTYAVKAIIPQNQYDYTDEGEKRHNNYIDDNVGYVLSILLDFQKNGKWFEGPVSPLLYLAYYLSLVLFLFRLSSLRVWLYALLGLGIIMLVYFLYAITISSEPFWFIIFATVLYLLIAVIGINSKSSHNASAVFLHWFIIQQPVIWFMFYMAVFDSYNVYDKASKAKRDWIEANMDMLSSYNLLFSIIILLFIALPLWRKWQSNPQN